MKEYTQIFKQEVEITDFYGETYMLDPREYRGKGRPRNTDYSPRTEVVQYLMRLYNTQFNDYLDMLIKR